MDITNGTRSEQNTSAGYHIAGLPPELRFSQINAMNVIGYLIMFVLAGAGNLTVFVTLFRLRGQAKSKVNRFIMHLCIADLLTTFTMMPIEIAWNVTVEWLAGDFACRFFSFFRSFGFYLSSYILIAISIDRYFAITQPLRFAAFESRSKAMLLAAWATAVISTIPQVR